ncbi:hypothetical protein HN615_05930 [Candidatus Woesearchaeota archaeon]|nr:hypothetical protein [Candidatus Neomarinimicrobiota bacterium]MBT7556446.1 hypothetical protein [Candidatus Woesearchaeota archaeon]
MAQTSIWPGSGSAVSESTPFGTFDNQSTFQTDAPKFATWAARRLGYPIMDVELQDTSFYACFEEASLEYSSQVNQYNIIDNLLQLKGQSTGSDLTHKNVTPTLGRTVALSNQYGTEATLPVGGQVDLKKGSITVNSGSQLYDLNALYAAVSESGKAIEIRRVYHGATPAIQRYFDPYATTGYGTQNLIEGFGFGSYSPAVSFTMMPIFEDLLRVQAIEMNDEIRKSAYSFHLVNNKLRIFPDPSDTFKVWFDYYLTEDKSGLVEGVGTSVTSSISDFSNVPYNNMSYNHINDPGKTWIRKYGLALSKEILGAVRSKYGTIPIPNSEVTMDGDALRTEAATEKEQLITQLRETLEQTSRRALTEKDQEESEFLQQKLNKVPIPIFIG